MKGCYLAIILSVLITEPKTRSNPLPASSSAMANSSCNMPQPINGGSDNALNDSVDYFPVKLVNAQLARLIPPEFKEKIIGICKQGNSILAPEKTSLRQQMNLISQMMTPLDSLKNNPGLNRSYPELVEGLENLDRSLTQVYQELSSIDGVVTKTGPQAQNNAHLNFAYQALETNLLCLGGIISELEKFESFKTNSNESQRLKPSIYNSGSKPGLLAKGELRSWLKSQDTVSDTMLVAEAYQFLGGSRNVIDRKDGFANHSDHVYLSESFPSRSYKAGDIIQVEPPLVANIQSVEIRGTDTHETISSINDSAVLALDGDQLRINADLCDVVVTINYSKSPSHNLSYQQSPIRPEAITAAEAMMQEQVAQGISPEKALANYLRNFKYLVSTQIQEEVLNKLPASFSDSEKVALLQIGNCSSLSDHLAHSLQAELPIAAISGHISDQEQVNELSEHRKLACLIKDSKSSQIQEIELEPTSYCQSAHINLVLDEQGLSSLRGLVEAINLIERQVGVPAQIKKSKQLVLMNELRKTLSQLLDSNQYSKYEFFAGQAQRFDSLTSDKDANEITEGDNELSRVVLSQADQQRVELLVDLLDRADTDEEQGYYSECDMNGMCAGDDEYYYPNSASFEILGDAPLFVFSKDFLDKQKLDELGLRYHFVSYVLRLIAVSNKPRDLEKVRRSIDQIIADLTEEQNKESRLSDHDIFDIFFKHRANFFAVDDITQAGFPLYLRGRRDQDNELIAVFDVDEIPAYVIAELRQLDSFSDLAPFNDKWGSDSPWKKGGIEMRSRVIKLGKNEQKSECDDNSYDFMEMRDYTAGDDLRAIRWHALGPRVAIYKDGDSNKAKFMSRVFMDIDMLSLRKNPEIFIEIAALLKLRMQNPKDFNLTGLKFRWGSEFIDSPFNDPQLLNNINSYQEMESFIRALALYVTNPQTGIPAVIYEPRIERHCPREAQSEGVHPLDDFYDALRPSCVEKEVIHKQMGKPDCTDIIQFGHYSY
jgi:hypothetical protein